jgi:ABC transporter with metal-binding/Fe-S-binding domain ATP-binding protein
MRVVSLISGGKDSWYALYVAMQYGFDINSIITFIPKKEDSYMLHYVNVKWTEVQAKLAGLKHHIFYVSGEKEKEVEEMKEFLMRIVKKDSIEGLICGAVKSEYQKHRIDMICEELGIKSYAPLWHKNEELILQEMADFGFKFIITRSAAEGIEKWVGKKIDENNISEFISDLKRAKASLIGEGGEYETFLLNAPFFEKEIKIVSSKIIKDDLTIDFIIEKIESC